MNIEFVELPEWGAERAGVSNGDPVLQEFADTLRSNPGRWAKYPREHKQPGQTAMYINHPTKYRAPKAFRDGGFEAKSRSGIIYVRYVGEPS